MNNSLADVKEFVKYVKKFGKGQDNLVVCPPATMLAELSKSGKRVLKTGAQNMHFAPSGAYTGEISANMIRETGAEYVIIGHSERRQHFGETDELLNKKVSAALAAGLKTIFCIGETLEEKTKYKSVLKKQIVDGLSTVNNFDNLIIAYEPVWAIGTGKVATTDDIEKVHSYIKSVVEETYKAKVRVLYGGSVKPSNSAEILALDSVDGVLIGGASLKAADFIKIAESRG